MYMISFENSNIPKYIKNRTSLTIKSSFNSKKVISCKSTWGMTNKNDIQNILNSYKKYSNKIIYVFSNRFL